MDEEKRIIIIGEEGHGMASIGIFAARKMGEYLTLNKSNDGMSHYIKGVRCQTIRHIKR